MARPRTDIQPRILEAARERFLNDGVDGASLRQIARDAGTSIGMIYYYYPTKDDLFFGVVESVYEKLLRDLTAALHPDAPVRERIRRMYVRFGSMSVDEIKVVKMVVRDALITSSRFQRLLGIFLSGHVPLIMQTLAEGVQDGTFSKERHPIVLMMSTLALGGPPQLIRSALGANLPLSNVPSREQLANDLVDVLFEGIAQASDRQASDASPRNPEG